MNSNIDETSIRSNSSNDCEPAVLEHGVKKEVESPDVAKSPSRSRDLSMENVGDSPYSVEKPLSRKRKRSSSPRRTVYRGRDRSPYMEGRRRRRDDSERDNPKPARCLGVFGLSTNTRENDLRDIFSKYGKIQDIRIVRSFAFVYYKEIEEARLAKERCNGLQIKGRNIRVDYSMTDQPQSSNRSREWNRRPERYGNHTRRYYNRRYRSPPRRSRRSRS